MDEKIRAGLTAEQQKDYDEACKIVSIIQKNTTYDEANGKIAFQAENAKAEGLDEGSADQLAEYFADLTPEEASAAYNGLKGEAPVTSNASITLAAAAAILAEAGLSWLVGKLLDWGSAKFCRAYKGYNSVTRNVCNLLGC